MPHSPPSKLLRRVRSQGAPISIAAGDAFSASSRFDESCVGMLRREARTPRLADEYPLILRVPIIAMTALLGKRGFRYMTNPVREIVRNETLSYKILQFSPVALSADESGNPC